jgi:hypothetical protein
MMARSNVSNRHDADADADDTMLEAGHFITVILLRIALDEILM